MLMENQYNITIRVINKGYVEVYFVILLSKRNHLLLLSRPLIKSLKIKESYNQRIVHVFKEVVEFIKEFMNKV